MINKLVMDALKDLKIPVSFMEHSGNQDAYVIFSTIGYNDTSYADDKNDAIETRVAMTLWYNDFKYADNIQNIKDAMNKAGFSFISGRDLKDENYYGRAMLFYHYQEI